MCTEEEAQLQAIVKPFASSVEMEYMCLLKIVQAASP